MILKILSSYMQVFTVLLNHTWIPLPFAVLIFNSLPDSGASKSFNSSLSIFEYKNKKWNKNFKKCKIFKDVQKKSLEDKVMQISIIIYCWFDEGLQETRELEKENNVYCSAIEKTEALVRTLVLASTINENYFPFIFQYTVTQSLFLNLTSLRKQEGFQLFLFAYAVFII